MKPSALVIRTAGSNCDGELVHAFNLAGAATEAIHLRTLIDDPALFDRFDLIGIPGGFSYGDDIAAGKILALLMRRHLYPALRQCIRRAVPIFAPCNGFQALVKMGLLPGPATGEEWPADEPPPQTVTLADNSGGRFIDDWVRVEINPATSCIWTHGLRGNADSMMLPIAHGEGRFVADDATLDTLEHDGRVVLRYAEGENPNGSMNCVAGICDSSGLIFGLMPHPERFTSWMQHPHWTRLESTTLETSPLGLQMFRNAVEHAMSLRVA